MAALVKNKGLLVAFEGISASGKSDNINSIACALQDQRCMVKLIEWNTNPVIRKLTFFLAARKLLHPFIYSVFQIISFMIDYFCKYRYYLKQGYLVLADRYIHTAISRDMANGLSFSLSKSICRLCKIPDILFFIDVHPLICLNRMKTRNKSLLHTNKGLLANAKNNSNTDYHYLLLLKNAYDKIFSNRKIMKTTKLIITDNNLEFMLSHILEHLNMHGNSQQSVYQINLKEGKNAK